MSLNVPPPDPQHSKRPQATPATVSTVHCPFCDSTNTRKDSDFGTTLAYAQFYCGDCRTMFEWLKWEDRPDDQNLPGFLTKR